MGYSNKKIVIILVLMCISIACLAYSFAYVSDFKIGLNSQVLTISDINYGVNATVGSFTLNNAIPTIDKIGEKGDAYTFSITNNDNIEHEYFLRFVDNNNASTIENGGIRYKITRNSESVIGSLDSSGVFDAGVIGPNATINFSLVLWLKIDFDMSGGTWNKIIESHVGKVNLDFSGANKPLTTPNMIPVYYDENDNVWRKADITNSDIRYKWYDYDNRMYANVVTIDSQFADLETYLNSELGTEIGDADISSQFVWIPRFKYTVFNSGFESSLATPREINIEFEKGISSTGTVKEVKSNNNLYSYKDLVNGVVTNGVSTFTHPSFTFNGEELEGFWYSKDSMYRIYDNSLIKPPLISAMRYPYENGLFYLSEIFESSRGMELYGNRHGFPNNSNALSVEANGIINNDDNNFDIHLNKFTEFSAVGFLTFSKYGKYTNPEYSGNDRYLYPYTEDFSKMSPKIITNTGNIYGIYELSQYIITMLNGTNNHLLVPNSSGLNSGLENRYYDAIGKDTGTNNYSFKRLGTLRELYNYSANTTENFKVINGFGTYPWVSDAISSNGDSEVIIKPVITVSSNRYMQRNLGDYNTGE